jgi:hypothetical protein
MPSNRWDESIRLVENDVANTREVNVLVRDEVTKAATCGDEDVTALFQILYR